MKKTYQKPQLHTLRLNAEDVICTTSVLDKDGGSNTELVPGKGEYNGEFNAPAHGWSSENWSGE